MDTSWVFDSLICYLNGPLWNGPLQSFIEEKSLIFEPNNNDEIEHKKIHEDFKNLVDLMLSTYMEDIGITPEQFEIACSYDIHDKIPIDLQENLFRQIWAANDYNMFQRMMMQRNVELQLQALELIEQKYGITPQLFIPKKRNLGESCSEYTQQTVEPLEEHEVLAEVIKHCEPEEIDIQTDNVAEEKEYLQKEKSILEQTLKNTSSIQNADLQTKSEIQELQQQVQVNDEDIKKRQAYLIAQRDKLIAMKKQVRKNRLQQEVNSTGRSRPQSAKAAEAVLHGEAQMQPKNLEIRRALAEKLRSEVIDNKLD